MAKYVFVQLQENFDQLVVGPIYYASIKKHENLLVLQSAWPWGYYAKWNKWDGERLISFDSN